MKYALAVVREAIASALSQPVASSLTVLMVAGMVLTVLLTTGRAVAAEQSVIATIDSAGTRSIVVRAEDEAGITSAVLDRMEKIEGIEWSMALSSATDATNARVPDGLRVPSRYAYGHSLEQLGIPPQSPTPGSLAYASSEALDRLGLSDVAGGIVLTNGADYSIGGRLRAPDYLASFEPLLLIPRDDPDGIETVNVVVIVAERPELVEALSAAVLSVFAPEDPTKLSVQTSEELAQLRSLIQGQLGTLSRGIALIVLCITGLLVAVILTGLVLLRRKDFGRRRALGATRALITTLVLVQTAILATLGAMLGTAVGISSLLASGSLVPGTAFIASVGTLGVSTAVAAALIPGLIAGRRQPMTELRVP